MFIEQQIDRVENAVEQQNLMISQLAQKIQDLKSEFQDSVRYEKQVYTTKDLADLLSNSVDYVRKGYILTGKVTANKTTYGYEISKDEFMRVKEIVMTRGKHYL